MQSDSIKKTTGAIYVNETFKGSGVIFIASKKLYCVTAAHNLYGLDLSGDVTPKEIIVFDYLGNTHSTLFIQGDKSVSTQYDIALLQISYSSLEEFGNILFSAIPNNKCPLIVRGQYGAAKNSVTWSEVFFNEEVTKFPLHFFCQIDKQKLINHVFAHGSEWLSGSSGSGLFYDDKVAPACVGILLEIPNKGDNGKLLFCGIEALNLLGANFSILPCSVFENDTDLLNDDWFKQKMHESIAALGKRYTPRLNFELPIAKIFNGISRNHLFKAELDRYYEHVYAKRRSSYFSFTDPITHSFRDNIDNDLGKLKCLYLSLKLDGNDVIDYDSLVECCISITEELANLIKRLYTEQELRERLTPTPHHSNRPFQNAINESYDLQGATEDFITALRSIACKVSNLPYIIMSGEAGCGKSHLLADVVTKRDAEGKRSLLLLGQHFVSSENPWSQILRIMLKLQGDENYFLSILNAKAHLSGHRIIIFIDAINEGNGKIIWKDFLLNFIQSIRNYAWLGVVFSIRTTYEDIIVDKSIFTKLLAIPIKHSGFSDVEFEASDYFFDNYGIKRPGIPLLHPEFKSPLFLKLFCDGLKAKNLSQIPTGYSGITSILDFYLEGINDKLSVEFDYPQINLVKKAVYAIAEHISFSGTSYIEWETVFYFLNGHKALQLINNKPSFIGALIHEGVLSKNLYYKEDGTYEEGVYFSYERFFDHLVGANLLDGLGDNPVKDFRKGGKLFHYFSNVEACYYHSGLIEALSVQIPERYDLEFFDLVPHVWDSSPVANAFLQSIVWRKHDSFEEKDLVDTNLKKMIVWWKNLWTGYPKGSKKKRVLDYLHEIVLEKNDLQDEFLYQIFLIGSVPGHIFNADFLHKSLIEQSMPERDGTFLPWLNSHFMKTTPVSRLIEWAWKDDEKLNLTDESVVLSCTLLGWIFISSNRLMRDSATKAMVCLLQHRQHLLVTLLRKFEDVDDPYVLERFMGVSFGCTLRSQEFSFLPGLCEYLFSSLFNNDMVYPHLLVRDYARGIIEYAMSKDVVLSFDYLLAYPPYKSEPIKLFPTNEQIYDKYFLDDNIVPNAYYQNAILGSMVTEYGKGTGQYGDFGRYVFERALRNWNVDVNALSNYAIQRIFDIGYQVEIHGGQEAKTTPSSQKHHNERIGKKYQWIAFMEILARVADHEKMYPESDYKKETSIPYVGAWQPNVRDIDLSVIIRETLRTKYNFEKTGNGAWWINNAISVDSGINNTEWMLLENDIPNVQNLIEARQNSGDIWISLELMLNMDEEKKIGEDSYDGPRKRMYLQIRSYLVKNEEFETFIQFGQQADFRNRWMPESSHKRGILSREYYWSQAYQQNQEEYFGGNGDESIHSQDTGEFIANVHVPVEEFMWEEEFDLSKNTAITFYRPSEKLWQGLRLDYGHLEGEYVDDEHGIVVCMDPSVNTSGPSCLLIKKEFLIRFLEKNDYKICWTAIGEKQILGSDNSGTDDNPRTNHSFNGFYWLDIERLQGTLNSEISNY